MDPNALMDLILVETDHDELYSQIATLDSWLGRGGVEPDHNRIPLTVAEIRTLARDGSIPRELVALARGGSRGATIACEILAFRIGNNT